MKEQCVKCIHIKDDGYHRIDTDSPQKQYSCPQTRAGKITIQTLWSKVHTRGRPAMCDIYEEYEGDSK